MKKINGLKHVLEKFYRNWGYLAQRREEMGIEFFDYVKDYIIDHGNMCRPGRERLGLMTATSFQNLNYIMKMKNGAYSKDLWTVET